jgi:O-antigen/teichoic acid export membrane protein
MVAKVLGNTAWLVSERVLGLTLMFVASVVVARYLGPEDFGRLTWVVAYVGLFAPLSTLGLGFVVTREILATPGSAPRLLATAVSLRVLGAVISLALMLVVQGCCLATAEGDLFFVALVGASAISVAALVLEAWFQARIESEWIVVARIATIFVCTGLRVLAAQQDLPLETFVYIQAFENLLGAALLSASFFYRAGSAGLGRPSVGLGKHLLRRSLWLATSGVMAGIYLKIDLIMLRAMASDEAVGIYSVAARVSEAWYFLPTAIAASFFPVLMKTRSEAPLAYRLQLQRLSDGLFSIGFVAAVVVTLVAGPLIHLLYGPEYAAAGRVLAVHIWGGIFISMRALLSKWLVLEGYYRSSLVTHGLGAVVNVIANLLLIPRWGITGAALASVLAYAMASYGALFFDPQTRSFARVCTASLGLPLRGVAHLYRRLAKT